MRRLVGVGISLTLVAAIVVGCGQNQSTKKQDESAVQPMQEVLAPAKEVIPENESNSVGLMAFYPNNTEEMFALAGTNTFTLYFQNKQIEPGEGKIGVYNAQSNAIYTSVEATDKDKFDVEVMDDIGKSLTGWEDGTKIDIYFDKVFMPGTSYYILMDEGAFNLGEVKSEAITNSSLITFSTKNYGVDMAGVNFDKNYNVGDSVSFTVLVDGEDSTMYALKAYDTSFIEASPINGSSDTDLALKFLKKGNPSITISFYKSGKTVDSITFTFNVESEAMIDVANKEISSDDQL